VADQALFRRRATITVDTLEVPCGPPDGFDVQFTVEKRHDGKPNTCELKVWNLSTAHRGELSAKFAAAHQTIKGKLAAAGSPGKRVLVQIEAGYKNGVSRIFRGDLRLGYHGREGADIITTVEAGDGEFSISRAKIFRSWAPGTPVSTVLRDVAGAMGVGVGNLPAVAALLGGGDAFVGGTTCSGKASRELRRICQSAGLDFSIQDGTLQFLATGKPFDGTAVLVSETTGMIGAPNLDHKGRLEVRTLLMPDLFPGRKIKLDAAELQGFYRIDKVKFTGDTFGNDWFVDLDCLRL